jgi:phosphoribosyl-AMP cyclohydrolase
MKSLKFIESLKFEKGLIPVVIQDIEDGEVLMLAYMNKDSL